MSTKPTKSKQAISSEEGDNKPFFRETQTYSLFEREYARGKSELTSEKYDLLKSKVFQYRPNIQQMVQEIGEKSFFDFAKSQVKENKNKIIRERKHEVIESIRLEVKKRLGDIIAESVTRQLKDNSSVSTIYPFAPIGHPYVLNSALQDILPGFGSKNPQLQNIIVLSCADVSFNNLRFPRGHLFHAFKKETVSLDMFTFFGHAVDSHPVIFHAPYNARSIEEMKKDILRLRTDGKITKPMLQKLMHIIDSIYATPHALSADNFSDQLTVTNYWLWKRMFQKYASETPNMIFLAQEEVTLRLITDYHLDRKTTIHNILFDQKYEQLLEKHFKGIMGSFSKQEKYGTYLFWGLPKGSKHRHQMWKEGNELVSDDKSFRVPLTPDGLRLAIQNQELIPSLLLTFITLAFYYGMFLGGGVDQTLYLEQMKKAFIAMQKEYGDDESMEAAADTITSHFFISRPALAFIEGPHGDRVPATGMDFLLYGDQKNSWREIYQATKQVTLAQIMDRIYPSFYKEYTPGPEKDEAILGITPRDIGAFTGLDEKIPCFSGVAPELIA